MAHGVFERVGVQICRRQHAPASAVTASCIDGNPYVEHHDEIVIVVATSLCQRVRNCYLLQSHVGIIICILAQLVWKANPNGGEGVYRNGRTAVDVVQNDGGIRPEVCKPIFVGTDPDLYIRRWAAEKLRDGNGITKYYMIKLHY
jgi:hypothetical protein